MRARTALLVLCLTAAQPATSYPEQPPPGHSGAPGEPNCGGCHFGGEDQGATLQLRGLPQTFTPGQAYALEVRLSSPALRNGGFQLSAKQSDGSQAGKFSAASSDVTIQQFEDVSYPGHARANHAAQPTDHTVAWLLHWIAPETTVVDFHLAAVAGNDDESPLGDTVLGYSVTLPAEGH